MIVSEDNAGQYYPDYARCHPLFIQDMRILSDSTVSRFLPSVTRDQIAAFFDAWNRRQEHRRRICISYDSTNKNFQAGELDLVEFGHPKQIAAALAQVREELVEEQEGEEGYAETQVDCSD